MSLIFVKRVLFLPKCSQFGENGPSNSEKVSVCRKKGPFCQVLVLKSF